MKVLFTTLDARHVDTVDEMRKVSYTLTHPDNAFATVEGLRGAEYRIMETMRPNDVSTVYFVNDTDPVAVVTVFDTDRAASLITVENGMIRFKPPVAMGRVEGYSDVYVAYEGKHGAWDVFSMSKDTLRATLSARTKLPEGKAQHKKPAPERKPRAYEPQTRTQLPMNTY